MGKKNKHYFIKPPSHELMKSWKTFLLLGTRLDDKKQYLAGGELFSTKEIDNLLAGVGIGSSCTLRETIDSKAYVEASLATRKETRESLIEAIKNDAYFPFLKGMPFSVRAALALISAKYATTQKAEGIQHLERLFRLLSLPLEDYEFEGSAFTSYLSSKKSYLSAYRHSDTQELLIYMNKRGYKEILGIEIAEILIDENSFSTMSTYLIMPQSQKKQHAHAEISEDSAIPTVTLEDVILPDADMLKLKTIVKYAQIEKDKPFKLLFYGSPGMGKTQTAKALAGSLRKPLITATANKIFGMFVGETEKTISKYFERAESQQAILLFDEADSFLKERTHSCRRWELSEVNHILTLIETSKAFVILCTNFFDSIDTALLRRMQEIIEFKIPTIEAREEIWRLELAKNSISTDNIDIHELSKIVISGGLVANAALNAARQQKVHTDLVLDTETLIGFAKSEQKKMGSFMGETRKVGFGA